MSLHGACWYHKKRRTGIRKRGEAPLWRAERSVKISMETLQLGELPSSGPAPAHPGGLSSFVWGESGTNAEGTPPCTSYVNAKEPGLEPPPHAQTTEASVVVEVHGAEGGKPVAQTPNKPPPRPIDGPTAPLIDLVQGGKLLPPTPLISQSLRSLRW